MLSSSANELLQRLLSPATALAGNRPLPQLVSELQQADVLPLVRQLARHPEHFNRPEFQTQMSAVISRLAAIQSDDDEINRQTADLLEEIYRSTDPELPLACGWLMWLASLGGDYGLQRWADLFLEVPPKSLAALQWAFAPVLDRDPLPAGVAQKLIGEAIADPLIAPAVLDLFNYRFRKRLTRPHAAAESAGRFTSLLSQLVQRMQRIEEGHLPEGKSPAEISQNINNSVAMMVALCDALGLCRFGDAEGALRQALSLKHRRIQTEAGGALARMDIAAGHEALVRLASEPVARMRVLAYADEMGLLERIPEEQQSETARAESKLAVWLAEPTQIGMAPTKMELIDRREIFWPGFDNPVECYLFRYEYGTQFVSTGIAGPCVHSFSAETSWMTPADLLAAYAGWQTEHPDIYHISGADFAMSHVRDLEEFHERMESAGIENVMLQLAGNLFGEWIPVATANRNGQPGTVTWDGTQPHWYPDPEDTEIDPEFIWTIELGRRLLKNFNPDGGF